MVPFSPASGLLEWVEDTVPMAEYLLGPNRTTGAHQRYRRPGDYSWVDCYTRVGGEVVRWGGGAVGNGHRVSLRYWESGRAAPMRRSPPLMRPRAPHPPGTHCMQLANTKPEPELLRAAFEAVCARYPPVMHHFFLENFRDPGVLCSVQCAVRWLCMCGKRQAAG